MHGIETTDPFFTPEVVEYMREKNLENISYEEQMEVLQAIIDVYSPKAEIHYDWTNSAVLHEAEAVYYTRKELRAKRQEAAKLVAEDDNVCTLDQVFAILSYRDMGFKEEYLDHEAQAKRNCPAHVEDLREGFFVTGYYPGRDQGPQTEKEWDELLTEADNEDEWVTEKDAWAQYEEWLASSFCTGPSQMPNHL